MDDEEYQDRIKTVTDTYRMVGNGSSVKWKANLEALFGSTNAVSKIIEWLKPHYEMKLKNDHGIIQRREQADQETVRLDTDMEIAEWFVTCSGINSFMPTVRMPFIVSGTACMSL